MDGLGAGTPTHAAWQEMSFWQAATQLCSGESEAVVWEATPVSEEEAAGMAETMAARPVRATAMENFILFMFVLV